MDIRVTVDAPGSAASATGMLLGELRDQARVDAAPAPEALPAGAKSGAGAALAELVVNGAGEAAVGAIAAVVTAFVQRRSARKVVLKVGEDELTVEGLDARTQKALVEDWLRRHGD
ncbi:hypothetical protein [Actinosynnema sp. NPDC020468]|uniref:hypothetical protein n=1 Tax=Actinosynnema sp. NPDC020468 TaxID=3154488 RepID=UPI0033D2BEA1